MRCEHEFFKPGSLKCARCGEPMQRQARHVRVGPADTLVERLIVDREIPGSPWHEAECLFADDDAHAGMCGFEPRMVGRVLVRPTGVTVAIATAEMRGAV